MAFGTLRADTIQSDGGTAKTVNDLLVAGANIGAATATTPATGDNDTSVATTAFVKAQNYLTSGANIGAATATTPNAGDNDTSVATTAFVQAEGFTKASAENTWTAGQRGEVTTVTSGTTITIDFDLSNNFVVALGHNVTTVAVSNATVGQSGSIFFAQPTSGSTTHTVQGWNSAFKFPGGSTNAPTMTAAINKVDRVDYVIRATDQIHVVATLDMAV